MVGHGRDGRWRELSLGKRKSAPTQATPGRGQGRVGEAGLLTVAWLAETGADPAKVNVHGGAIAIGHPLGASGARPATTLLGVLERTGGRYGLQTMCEADGTANATIIERL